MLKSLRVIFFLLAAPPTLLAIILFFALDNHPLNSEYKPLNQSDIQRAKQILNLSAKNKQQIRSLRLNEKDLNIALNYLLNYLIESSSKITLKKNSLYFQITLFLPQNILDQYLNINFNLTKSAGFPVINALKIGRMTIADEFAGQLIESIINYTPLKQYYILAAQHIRNIHIGPDTLTITYLTNFQNNHQSDSFRKNNRYQSLLFYHQQINQLVLQQNPEKRLSLAELLKPLFLSAYQRSTTKNAIDENQALILAVSSYVNQKALKAFLPIELSTDTYSPVFLYQRIDMAKHFVTSAALAASGAAPLANMLGEEKEISDSKVGSGFSFIDLASDMAGLKFGLRATSTSEKARRLQKNMINIQDYHAFMPDVRDLPETMDNRVFKQRFGSIYSPTYQKMLKLINTRINALIIYQHDYATRMNSE